MIMPTSAERRSLLRELCPPLLLAPLRTLRRRWLPGPLRGPYRSWDLANQHAAGYAAADILVRVAAATREVVAGRAAFERDGVVFDRGELNFPLLAGLLRQATRGGGHLHVVDFGGALGGTYHQCRSFLNSVPTLRWSIIEQAHFVDAGRAEFETDVLRFFSSVEECEQVSGVDAILLSSVLQYLPDARSLLRTFVAMAVPTIIVDRSPEVDTRDDIFAVQVVPPEIYPASYAFRAFGKGAIESMLGDEYRSVACFDAVDPDMSVGVVPVRFRGWIFERS